MEIILYGTRGSVPISNHDSVRYGGNTTSVRITSVCLPQSHALVVDGGSGYVPLCADLLRERIFVVDIFFTHYHHDHTQGIPLAPHTFMPTAFMNLWGPEEYGAGPQAMLEGVMRPPYFPVAFAKVRHRFNCHNLKTIGTQVLVVHPEGGFQLIPVHIFEQAERLGKQLVFGKARFPVGECLVIRMYKTAHPEYTVSYRFEERPTGRVFVFLTDHEVTAAVPGDLKRHLKGAHLLVQDAQYSRVRYESSTAGFGHGTPEYAVELALEAGAGRLGLTHHDPAATDSDIDARTTEARRHAESLGHPLDIFACFDYQIVEV